MSFTDLEKFSNYGIGFILLLILVAGIWHVLLWV